jgi:DNA-binding response OmpR family regulator
MKSILAIIDEPELVRTLRRDLENARCRLVSTGDGQTALTLMQHPPCYILTVYGVGYKLSE